MGIFIKETLIKTDFLVMGSSCARLGRNIEAILMQARNVARGNLFMPMAIFIWVFLGKICSTVRVG
jgi:hypothetical protein